jgi:hypothetical protein
MIRSSQLTSEFESLAITTKALIQIDSSIPANDRLIIARILLRKLTLFRKKTNAIDSNTKKLANGIQKKILQKVHLRLPDSMASMLDLRMGNDI